jgi:hypothetical protein
LYFLFSPSPKESRGAHGFVEQVVAAHPVLLASFLGQPDPRPWSLYVDVVYAHLKDRTDAGINVDPIGVASTRQSPPSPITPTHTSRIA